MKFAIPRALSLLLLATASIAVSAQAQTSTPSPGERFEQRVDKREARQQQRISNGIASGQLTPREAARLTRQQVGVERAEAHAEADGKISRAEAYRLEKRQDATSRHIRRQKHDRQVEPQS